MQTAYKPKPISGLTKAARDQLGQFLSPKEARYIHAPNTYGNIFVVLG